jgi:hypothetical protein
MTKGSLVMSNREDIPLVLYPDCDYIDDEVYYCCIQCYRYDTCVKCWMRENLMKYSMDFKSRVIVVDKSGNKRANFCFYDYNKYHDIKCYEKSGEEIPEETVKKEFARYYSESSLSYFVKKENVSELGLVWVCMAKDPSGMLYFLGYSETSAAQAVEDCDTAKNLILDRYYWKL